MRVGIATDHGGFSLKEELLARLRAAGHEITDFGAHSLDADDDYPDFVVPLAEAVVAGQVQRGVAICGSGVGASVCANKVDDSAPRSSTTISPRSKASRTITSTFSAWAGGRSGQPSPGISSRRFSPPSSVVPTAICDDWRKWRAWKRPLAPERMTMTTTTITDTQMAQLAINTIRTLSMDAVQAANSGHPGTPMALAPLVYTLWNRVMRFDPHDPIWPDRDRFVLSNGHASMLLWSVLHLTGTRAVNADYERLGEPSVTLDDIRQFRQLDSKAPGHPDTVSSPGSRRPRSARPGHPTSVGMAMGERWLADRYNRPGFDIFDYNIYAICGDGCLMEGVSAEAASLAGHLGLDNLCWIFDNNHITIKGTRTSHLPRTLRRGSWPTVGSAARGRCQRHRWHRGRPRDLPRHNRQTDFHYSRQRHRLRLAEPAGDHGRSRRATRRRGNPAHETRLRLARGRDVSRARWRARAFASGLGKRGAEARRAWTDLFAAYRRSSRPGGRNRSDAAPHAAGGLGPESAGVPADAKGVAGREASGKVLNVLAQNVPWLLGGSADLGPSNKTTLKFAGVGDLQAKTPGGRNVHFGVREHAMGSIMNGLSLTKVAAIRRDLLHLQRLRAAGDAPFRVDGAADDLRLHPRCDGGRRGRADPSTGGAPGVAARNSGPGHAAPRRRQRGGGGLPLIMPLRHEPAVLVLSRQPLPTLDRSRYAQLPASPAALCPCRPAQRQAGCDPDRDGERNRAGRGGARSAARRRDPLARRLDAVMGHLRASAAGYRDSILPPAVTARVAIEQASAFGWERYVGRTGRIIAMQTFGASAPLKELQKEYGFTVDKVVAAARDQLDRRKA